MIRHFWNDSKKFNFKIDDKSREHGAVLLKLNDTAGGVAALVQRSKVCQKLALAGLAIWKQLQKMLKVLH